MDLSKFKTSDWLKVGGAVVFLVAYFLDWTSSPFSSINLSGSDFLFRGTLPWLLVLAVGVITFLLAAQIIKSTSVPWQLIFLAATALATLLVLIYLIHPSYSGVTGIGRGVGAFLALIGSAAALAGSFMGFTEGGGSLNDLKDMNKIKSQFNQGGQGGSVGGGTPPPPPPPGGMTPPPPPPPPVR
ncbi:MAG: hypothetical protein ABIQ39_11270 [Ilumatobacteraceae bacterium]